MANRSPLRCIAIGDIGSTDAFHVGDEAMMLGLMRDIDAAGDRVQWTLMSTRPAVSSARFGTPAVPRLDFSDCPSPASRDRRLAEFDEVLAEPPARWGLVAPPPWRASLAAIAASDAAVIAGGGNLCLTWPEQVFERTVVARAARRAGKPLAITGQTIGPTFDARTRELVAEILTTGAFVGVRERHSLRVALDLGAPPERTALQCDDAIGIRPVEPSCSSAIVGDGPFIAVTLNHMGDLADPHGIMARLAAQLIELGRRTGATIVLVPHVGDLNGATAHDVAVNGALLAATGGESSRLRAAPLPSPEEAAWYCRHAQLVVSSRYHPVVFAVAAGTPALFLYQDHYTLVKGRGALALVGLEEWILPVGLGALGLLAPAASELWRRRQVVRAHLRGIDTRLAASRRQHADALYQALTGGLESPVSFAPLAPAGAPLPQDDWIEAAHDGFAPVHARIAADHWQVERASLIREHALHANRAGKAT